MVTGKAPADDFVDYGAHRRTCPGERVFDPRRNLGKRLSVNEAPGRQTLQFAAQDPRRHRLPLTSEHQRALNLAVPLRILREHPQDTQLVLAAYDLIEGD